VEITLSCYYRSKTYWEEFIVDGRNDFYNKKGFDGILAETTVINLFYKIKLKPFYIFKSVDLKIIFENIFNRTQKYNPIGNSINRAFIFEVAGEIWNSYLRINPRDDGRANKKKLRTIQFWNKIIRKQNKS